MQRLLLQMQRGVTKRSPDARPLDNPLLLSWYCLQGTLSTAGLPEVTTAHTQLNAYATTLQEELTARQAAVTALTAEVARQVGGPTVLRAQQQQAHHHSAQMPLAVQCEPARLMLVLLWPLMLHAFLGHC
jgi:hypothetical protein